MTTSIRIATFNCENLFRRSKVLNLRDETKSSALLGKIKEIQALIDKADYTEETKQEIYEISRELRPYIDFRIDNGGFGAWRKDEGGVSGFKVYKSCTGRSSWSGQIIFLDESFSDVQRQNTARVITDTDADILCAIEVEGMAAIRKFNSEALGRRFRQFMSIDSPNDPRGIDVACLSKYPIKNIRTHIFDSYGSFKPVFSRDCLELTISVAEDVELHVLCNHFKSQRSRSTAEAEGGAAKRLAQSQKVVEILQENYNLAEELVVVMGDLNEDPSSGYNSLAPLFDCENLKPVIDPALPAKDRYTYYYPEGKAGEMLSQLDHMFVSEALHKKLKKSGFVREGIFDINKATEKVGAAHVEVYETVTDWCYSASDHAAIWAEFEI